MVSFRGRSIAVGPEVVASSRCRTSEPNILRARIRWVAPIAIGKVEGPLKLQLHRLRSSRYCRPAIFPRRGLLKTACEFEENLVGAGGRNELDPDRTPVGAWPPWYA
jgi:hypothetical protein